MWLLFLVNQFNSVVVVKTNVVEATSLSIMFWNCFGATFVGENVAERAVIVGSATTVSASIVSAAVVGRTTVGATVVHVTVVSAAISSAAIAAAAVVNA